MAQPLPALASDRAGIAGLSDTSMGEASFSALPPRHRILIAARELFNARGINAVGVEAIAEAALTNKMTLYRHFRSKDDLIFAYAKGLAEEGEAIWDQLAVSYPDDPEARVNAWVDYVEYLVTGNVTRGCALANASVELAPTHPAREVIEHYKLRKRERLVNLLREVGYGGPDRLADEVFLLFEGARVSLQCGAREPALRVVQMLRDLLARGERV